MRLMTRLVAVGTATLIGLGAGPAAVAGPPSPGAPGLGDRLYPLLGNGGYDVDDYDLRLTYPEKVPAQQVTGDVTIRARAARSLSRFNLDFGGDGVGRVSVDGRPATFTRSGDELVITPRRPLAARRPFTVTVEDFTATPVVPSSGAPAGFAVSLDGTVLAGQPGSAHRLFPSNDHPRDKATYTITLTAPPGWTGTANGRLVRTRTGEGLVSTTYRQAQPMAAELVQVAVGDFVVHTRPAAAGVPIRDVVPRRLAARLLPKAADEGRQMAWLVGLLGPYPFDTYGSLIIDGNLGFALETQTLSLYDTAFFSLPDHLLNPVLAHELAHQWFGDSVAPYSWSDVWLNEGHATWYELQYAEHTGRFTEYSGAPTLAGHMKKVYAQANLYRKTYGPVAAPLKADSMWDVFNPNVYGGGALVLYALRQQIGTPAFQRLERAWVRRHEGRSASTQDFVALASAVARQDLRPFLNDWLYGTTVPAMPGHPDWR
jgi:aminopeptidase N